MKKKPMVEYINLIKRIFWVFTLLMLLSFSLVSCKKNTNNDSAVAESEETTSAETTKDTIDDISDKNLEDSSDTTEETNFSETIENSSDKTEENPSDEISENIFSETIEDPLPEEYVNFTAWTVDRVNFRAKPGTDAPVIGKISRKAQVLILKELAGWDYVEYNGEKGYISSDYISFEEPKGNGFVICLDPGHQRKGDSTPEPNGPGSSTKKARVTSGTTGRTTGVPEYKLNLDIALKLRNELENRGYTVVMTRETHDVNISNMERAQFAANNGADITVRIHANGSDNTGISGALTMAPSSSNAYVSSISEASQRLSKSVINEYCAMTGMNNQGVMITDTMTGINWCTMPVTIVEMGYMTNPNDDTNMQNPDFQSKMVSGIANGIDKYFIN